MRMSRVTSDGSLVLLYESDSINSVVFQFYTLCCFTEDQIVLFLFVAFQSSGIVVTS